MLAWWVHQREPRHLGELKTVRQEEWSKTQPQRCKNLIISYTVCELYLPTTAVQQISNVNLWYPSTFFLISLFFLNYLCLFL